MKKFLNKHQKPIKATRVFVATFYCHICGQVFDTLPECEQLGYSPGPRPKDLTSLTG